MDSEFLPSKKFVKIASIIIAVFVLIVLAKQGVPTVATFFKDMFSTEKQIDPEKVEAFQTYRELDTDGDGLYDWEEALFGTDITKADTNGDGVSDYIEFYSAQDSSEGVVVGTVSTEYGGDQKQLTNTDMIARDLYSALQISKQQSGEITEEDREALAEIASKSIQTFDYFVFLEKDFVISSDPSIIPKFKSEFNKITSATPVRSQDVTAIMKSIDLEQPMPFDVLGRVAQYKNYLISHTKITVPIEYKKEYIGYVNSLSKFLTALELIAKNDTDPVAALGAFTEFQNSLDGYRDSILKMEKIIR